MDLANFSNISHRVYKSDFHLFELFMLLQIVFKEVEAVKGLLENFHLRNT